MIKEAGVVLIVSIVMGQAFADNINGGSYPLSGRMDKTMSALDELIEKREKGERLTSLEFAVFWCSDAIASEQAAKELADYELRLDLLAKGATWEHEDNERLKEDNAALRARVEALEAALKPFAEIPCLENFDDNQLFDPAGGVLAGDIRKARAALKA